MWIRLLNPGGPLFNWVTGAVAGVGFLGAAYFRGSRSWRENVWDKKRYRTYYLYLSDATCGAWQLAEHVLDEYERAVEELPLNVVNGEAIVNRKLSARPGNQPGIGGMGRGHRLSDLRIHVGKVMATFREQLPPNPAGKTQAELDAEAATRERLRDAFGADQAQDLEDSVLRIKTYRKFLPTLYEQLHQQYNNFVDGDNNPLAPADAPNLEPCLGSVRVAASAGGQRASVVDQVVADLERRGLIGPPRVQNI